MDKSLLHHFLNFFSSKKEVNDCDNALRYSKKNHWHNMFKPTFKRITMMGTNLLLMLSGFGAVNVSAQMADKQVAMVKPAAQACNKGIKLTKSPRRAGVEAITEDCDKNSPSNPNANIDQVSKPVMEEAINAPSVNAKAVRLPQNTLVDKLSDKTAAETSVIAPVATANAPSSNLTNLPNSTNPTNPTNSARLSVGAQTVSTQKGASLANDAKLHEPQKINVAQPTINQAPAAHTIKRIEPDMRIIRRDNFASAEAARGSTPILLAQRNAPEFSSPPSLPPSSLAIQERAADNRIAPAQALSHNQAQTTGLQMPSLGINMSKFLPRPAPAPAPVAVLPTPSPAVAVPQPELANIVKTQPVAVDKPVAIIEKPSPQAQKAAVSQPVDLPKAEAVQDPVVAEPTPIIPPALPALSASDKPVKATAIVPVVEPIKPLEVSEVAQKVVEPEPVVPPVSPKVEAVQPPVVAQLTPITPPATPTLDKPVKPTAIVPVVETIKPTEILENNDVDDTNTQRKIKTVLENPMVSEVQILRTKKPRSALMKDVKNIEPRVAKLKPDVEEVMVEKPVAASKQVVETLPVEKTQRVEEDINKQATASIVPDINVLTKPIRIQKAISLKQASVNPHLDNNNQSVEVQVQSIDSPSVTKVEPLPKSMPAVKQVETVMAEVKTADIEPVSSSPKQATSNPTVEKNNQSTKAQMQDVELPPVAKVEPLPKSVPAVKQAEAVMAEVKAVDSAPVPITTPTLDPVVPVNPSPVPIAASKAAIEKPTPVPSAPAMPDLPVTPVPAAVAGVSGAALSMVAQAAPSAKTPAKTSDTAAPSEKSTKTTLFPDTLNPDGTEVQKGKRSPEPGVPVRRLDASKQTKLSAGYKEPINYGEKSTEHNLEVSFDKQQKTADGYSFLRVWVRLINKATGARVTKEQTIRVKVEGVVGINDVRLSEATREIDRVVDDTPVLHQPNKAYAEGMLTLTTYTGEVFFDLLAPVTPGEVTLTIKDESSEKVVRYFFEPQLRELMAVGLIQGAIYLNKKQDAALLQSRTNDGFDDELRRFTREFANGSGYYNGRAAFYLKGAISGQTLLTASYDSDKDIRNKITSSVRPNELYPVFGDNSTTGSDVRSSDRAYVRLDNGANFALYGDFGTNEGFVKESQSVPLAGELKKLGQYGRQLTGIRLHAEQAVEDKEGSGKIGYGVNAFVSQDTLKRSVEEFRGQGISGPYAIQSQNAIQDTELVEYIVRDRNNVGQILTKRPMQRLVDYSFEPFSGRLLFKSPIPSQDENGNPVSIRVTYELDQGGERFFIGGVEGAVAPTKNTALGVSMVKDKNPLSPYELKSFSLAGSLFSSQLKLSTEVAQSQSHRYGTTDLPSKDQTFSDGKSLSGKAVRVGAKFDGADSGTSFSIEHGQSDYNFYNSAAPFQGGRGDSSIALKQKITAFWSLVAGSNQSKQKFSDNETVISKSTTNSVGFNLQLAKDINVEIGLRQLTEKGDSNLNTTQNPINGPSAGISATSTAGGFFGSSLGTVNPSTGLPAGVGTTQTPSGTSVNKSAKTAYSSLNYAVTPETKIKLELEAGSQSVDEVKEKQRERLGFGIETQMYPTTRLYARYDQMRGSSSIYALAPAEKSSGFNVGVTRDIAGENDPDNKTSLFSEYRNRRDDWLPISQQQQITTRDVQFANGIRQGFRINARWTVEGTAEYVKIIAGTSPDAIALTGAAHFRDEVWRVSNKLELRQAKVNTSDKTLLDDTQTWLWTVAAARKLDNDWTLLGKNYLLVNRYADHSGKLHYGNAYQERALVGIAYRESQRNRLSGVFHLEHKTEKDDSTLLKNKYQANIASLTGEYHPGRRYWFNGRIATKKVSEIIEGIQDSYMASLVSGRAIYDINDNIDVGLLASKLFSPKGGASQYAYGSEFGWTYIENLRTSLGYNVRGFYDRDLSASDYTRQGANLRIDYKF